MLVALLLTVSQQLAPAHAAPSAPVPETAPPATASPNLFDSIFPHLAAPAAARHSLSIRSAGEEAPTPESAEAESALGPRSHRDFLLPVHTAGCFGTLCSTLFHPACGQLAAATSQWLARQLCRDRVCPCPLTKSLAPSRAHCCHPDHQMTGSAAGTASACPLMTCTSLAVLRKTFSTPTTAPLAVNQPPCACSAAPSTPPSAPAWHLTRRAGAGSRPQWPVGRSH